MTDGRILIADGDPRVESPPWERYDTLANCRSPGWDATTGRATIFEKTDVGRSTVHFNDRNGTLNVDDIMGRAIQLQIRDPVTGLWEQSWRGVIDDATYDVYELTPGLVTNTQLQCVDVFSYLSRVELMAGVHGHVPLPGHEGSVTFGSQRVDDRIFLLLASTHTDSVAVGLVPNVPLPTPCGAGIPDAMYVVFTGNVNVWDTAYDPGESVLVAMRDAADAEFPGVANIFVDRRGRICFHGRKSRFDPDTTAEDADWTFTRWYAGDATAIAGGPPAGYVGTAQLRELSFSRSMAMIYNTAQCWPKFVETTKPNAAHDRRHLTEGEKKNSWFRDVASVADYGIRAMPTMGDLIVRNNFNDVSSTSITECRQYARYFVANYKNVHRIPVPVFKSILPTDPRAAATWALLTRIEISDVVSLTAGAAEMDHEQYFVEGWTKTVRPLTGDYDMVELRPNLSSVNRYGTLPAAGGLPAFP